MSSSTFCFCAVSPLSVQEQTFDSSGDICEDRILVKSY
jgi:hypothetical protein